MDRKLDVAVVGAGFSGLYMLHRLRGLGFSARVYEAGHSVGGTWFWNRYPGARVDVESQEYSYGFDQELEQEWVWSERYAAQPELLKYLNHVADRFDLRPDIQLNTRITAAVFDEVAGNWTLTTEAGETITARYCVMATGSLSAAKDLDFPGLKSFAGPVYHTNDWPEGGVDLKGKRVGIIGTGSSGVQTITTIAPDVAHLTVFQRTPSYSVPAHNGPADPAKAAEWKANAAEYRRQARESRAGLLFDPTERLATETPHEERQAIYEDRWGRGGFAIGGAFVDLLIDPAANATIADFVADKIRATVRDPATAEKLIPKTYPLGAKRLCVDTGYYEVFNRPNVMLVDIAADPIGTITPGGLVTQGGAEYDFEVLICATGFDAITGALNRIDIKGRGGQTLKETWAHGPRTYLGLMVAGFPNMFHVAGPGSPSVLSNMVVSIEQHVEWIADCISWLGERQLGVIEPTPAAQDAWVDHVNEVAEMTLYPRAASWYVGANVPGKPRVFMPYVGGVPLYREQCDKVAAAGYEGFATG